VTKNDLSSTIYEFGRLTLNKVTTPYGGSVSYRYSDTDFYDILPVKGEDAYAHYFRYAVLTARISEGSTFQFEEHWSNSDTVSRLVRTDIGASEYRYTKSVQDTFQAKESIDDTDVDLAKDGRLVSYKIFDDRNVPWSTNAQDSLLQQKTYTYKSLYRISDQVRTSAQRIVPDRVVSTYYPNDGSGSGESVFTSMYESYDERGYPTRVTQSSGDKELESTSLSYRHGGGMGDWFIGKLLSVQSTDDSERFNYNQFGDVSFVSVNGVSTQYDWHAANSNAGELHTVTTQPDNTTTYRDYKRGQAGYISTPEGRIQIRTIDDNGLLMSETRFHEPDGRIAPPHRYEYDSLHRLSKVDPSREKSASETLYWKSNNLLIAFDSDFRRYMRKRVLDGFGRTLEQGTYDIKQRRWSTIQYAYDAEGRLEYTSYPVDQDPENRINSPVAVDWQKLPGTHHRYDALGRVVSTRVTGVDGNDSVQTYAYGSDSSGNQTIARTDARGHTSTTTYKSYGEIHYKWPIKIVQPDNTETDCIRKHSKYRHPFILSHQKMLQGSIDMTCMAI